MNKSIVAIAALALACVAGRAAAQTYNARRMGMGGVDLGGTGANIAYRAVPAPPAEPRGFSLPIGLIQVLANPPQLDAGKPDFSIFDLANLLYTVPWNLQLTQPDPIASDVNVSISQDSLVVNLGDAQKLFPQQSGKIGAVLNGPSLGFSVHRVFIGLLPVVEYDNDLTLNDALHGALANADPFLPNTLYSMTDKARAQLAAGAELGFATPLARGGAGPADRSGFYVGARLKALRGLAYGDHNGSIGFTTPDTLFTKPVDVRYSGQLNDAGPDGGGWGGGADLGAVWIGHGVEIGVGVDDIGTQVGWKVRQSAVYSDSVTGGYVQQVLNERAPLESRIPTVLTVNAATQVGRALVAADLVSGVNNTQAHLGAEIWAGRVALRAGTYIDANKLIEGSLGTGVRFGTLGLDLAVSSHSRNVTQQRVLEMGAGISFYR